MEIKKRLLEDIKAAMKAQDSLRLNTLRLLHSEIKNKEIDHRRELSDDEIIGIASGQIKKRKEAIILYEKGNRQDLKDQNMSEIAIIEAYMPQQASTDDIKKRIVEVLKETGVKDAREVGKVMKILMPEFKGRADGNVIKTLTTEILSQQ